MSPFSGARGTEQTFHQQPPHLPAFEEFERRADVGDPVDPLQLPALFRGLRGGQGGVLQSS